MTNKISQTKTKQPNSQHCFVCGVGNSCGLQLEFYESSPGEVTVNTTIPDRYQGYPGVVHGGIVAALVDEALGRVHMGNDPENPRFMYTAKLSIRYRKPVPINAPIKIIAHAVKKKRLSATSVAKIYGSSDEILVDAEAVLVNVPEETIQSVDMETLGWKVYPD